MHVTKLAPNIMCGRGCETIKVSLCGLTLTVNINVNDILRLTEEKWEKNKMEGRGEMGGIN